MKNAVAEETPEYPPTPQNLEISPGSSRDEDGVDNSTMPDRQLDGKDTFEEGKGILIDIS